MALGFAGLLLAAGYTAVALRLPMGSAEMPGAGLFPLIAGPALALAALAMLRDGMAARASVPLELPTGEARRRILLVLGALTLHLLAMPWLGHLLSAFAMSTVLVRLLRGGWMGAALWGLALAAGAQVFFVRLLQVPLPRGEIAHWLGS
jgi:hypothetical protein